MANKTVKLDADIHKLVDEHTQKVGGKIGKFYDIAAKEKLDKLTKPKKFNPNYETKA